MNANFEKKDEDMLTEDRAMEQGERNREQETRDLSAQKEENPFPRKPKIPRTPPTARTRSLTDIELLETLDRNSGNTSKRKRLECSPVDSSKKQENYGDMLRRTLNKICTQIMFLEKEVTDSYKPKKEIVSVSAMLSTQVKNLKVESFEGWLNKMNEQEEKAEEEIANLRRQIVTMKEEKMKDAKYIDELNSEINELLNENHKLTKCVERLEIHYSREGEGEQNTREHKCPECKKLQMREAKRKAFTTDGSFECYQTIPEGIWEENLFANIGEKNGLIWEADEHFDLLLPCNKNFECSNKLVTKAIRRFAGIKGLERQNKEKGEVAVMLQAFGFPDGEDRIDYTPRGIYYPILVNEGDIAQSRDEDIFNALKLVKDHMQKTGRTHLAFPEIEGVVGVMLARMMEFIFYGTEIQLSRYIQAKESAKETKQPKSNQDAGSIALSKTRSKPKDNTILIKMEGISYAELLKKVKKDVNPDAVGVQVQNIRKTKKEELLLTVKQGTEKAEVLKQEIMNKLPEVSATIFVKKKIIHIKDLDEVTTVEDIKEAVAKLTSVDIQNFEVRALRPAFGNRQNATIIMTETAANKLIAAGKIKVGWTNCRIQERKREDRCFKCWEYGHTKLECKGPDRQNLCLRCTANDHRVSKCRNKPYCLTCKCEGHQTGAKNCVQRNKNVQNEISTDKHQ